MADNSSALSMFWPEIDDALSARAASQLGVWAMALFAAWTAGLVTYELWSGRIVVSAVSTIAYAQAAIFAMLGIGIWRLWRTAAIVALALFLLYRIFALLQGSGALETIVGVVFILFLISGVRGTFAFHRYTRDAQSQQGADA